MRSFNQRHLFVLAALAGSVAAVACGGDDDTTGGTGGSGGSGGSTGGAGGKDGGTAGKGGAGGADAGSDAAIDGKGGAAGSAGSAGKGGSAGSAGKGGSAGSAGAGGKGGSAGSSSDGGADAPTDGEGGATIANVRFAHLSPGAPAVDVCLATHGTTVFTGPVLSGQGVLTGLPYATVTKYQTVAPGQYDVRIVAAGATSCATALGGLPDQTNLPAIPANGAVTIAALGELLPGDGGGQPFALKAFVDDTSVASGSAKLRFVHASSGTSAVDVGTGGGVLMTPLFTNVAFGATAAATNGYVETAPLSNREISVRLNGATSDVLSIPNTELPSGAIATAFAIGKVGNALTPLRALLCLDNNAAVGALTPCSIVGETPKRAHVRVAHLSPDAPAVDVCLTPTNQMFGGTGILRRLNSTAGLAYPQVTTYLDIPIGSYSARLVAAAATDCNTAVVPDTPNIVTVEDLSATIAALGDLSVLPPDAGANDAGVDGGAADAATPPASSFGLKVFVDDRTAPVPVGNINLRFVHASPGTAAVDVGLGSGGSFTPLFANVAFRNFAVGLGIDPNGYASRAPLAAQTLSARLTGSTTDALVVPNVTVTAGSIASAFAIGKVGDTNKPLKLLLCQDSSAPAGLLTTCSVVP